MSMPPGRAATCCRGCSSGSSTTSSCCDGPGDRGFADETATSHEAAASLLEASSPEISTTDVERYYAEHRSDFQRSARARLRQILVEDRASAELAVAELEAGVDFGEVARIRSIGPSGPDGGFQGELSREDLPGALADVVFALEEGEWSELLEADYGFRIFQVERFLPDETLSLQVAAPSIRSRLVAERSEAFDPAGDRRGEAGIQSAGCGFTITVRVQRSLPRLRNGVRKTT